jgi:D-ribose pyranose/furanose isomerase RbsD
MKTAFLDVKSTLAVADGENKRLAQENTVMGQRVGVLMQEFALALKDVKNIQIEVTNLKAELINRSASMETVLKEQHQIAEAAAVQLDSHQQVAMVVDSEKAVVSRSGSVRSFLKKMLSFFKFSKKAP